MVERVFPVRVLDQIPIEQVVEVDFFGRPVRALFVQDSDLISVEFTVTKALLYPKRVVRDDIVPLFRDQDHALAQLFPVNADENLFEQVIWKRVENRRFSFIVVGFVF
jgi:hypothetical protein